MTEDRSPRAPPSLHHKEVAALSADDAAALDRMTEEEARGLLRRCGGFGGLEAWIAGRRWKTAPDGWIVTGELQG